MHRVQRSKRRPTHTRIHVKIGRDNSFTKMMLAILMNIYPLVRKPTVASRIEENNGLPFCLSGARSQKRPWYFYNANNNSFTNKTICPACSFGCQKKHAIIYTPSLTYYGSSDGRGNSFSEASIIKSRISFTHQCTNSSLISLSRSHVFELLSNLYR
jgi:hypothetical protein